jgi:hypothetical protein
MVTAVGTLLAALVALASLLVSQQFFADSPSGADPEQPAATDAQGKRLDEQVMWGPTKMLLASSMDFDDTQGPIRNSEFPDTDVYKSVLYDSISASYGMAKWAGDGKPSQNDCASLLATHGVSDDFSYEARDKFCFRTSKGRIAMFEVLGEVATGWEVQATAWKQRLTDG